MSSNRPLVRWLWVALVAITGLFSAVGEASACSTQPPRSCCAGSASRSCGCCPGGATHSPRSTTDRLSPPVRAQAEARIPGYTCECRSQDPAAPGPNKESRSHQERSDEGRIDTLALAFAPTAALTARAHPVSHPLDPPKSPLYLRVARLLI